MDTQREEQQEKNPIYDNFVRSRNKRTLEEKQYDLNEKVDTMVTRYTDLIVRLGPEHFSTQFQARMINMMLPVQQFCEAIMTMEESMILMDETMEAMDDAIDVINDCMVHNNSRYGVMDNFRQMRRMRKYWKTWTRRIKRINYMFASMTAGSAKFSLVMSKISSSMNKTSRRSKKSVPTAGVILSPEAQALVDKKLAERGETPPPASSPAAPSSPAPRGGDSGAPGVDDLV